MNQFLAIFILNFISAFSLHCQSVENLFTEIEAIQRQVYLDQNKNTDLFELKRLKSSKIVGLGEATHGTHEFLEYKSKIVRYLVEKYGLRLLLLEIDFGESVYLNECINDPNCNLHEKMKQMQVWVWRTEEVENLLSWLRKYNLSHKFEERVNVLGVDSQLTWKNLDLVDRYSQPLEPETVKNIKKITDRLRFLQFQLSVESSKREFENKLDSLNEFVKTNKKKYEFFLTNQELAFLHHALETINQSIINSDFNVNHRDRLMSENIEYLRRLLKVKKSAFWAHNIHVANYHPYRPEQFTRNTVGYFLKDLYGKKYVSIGFGFSSGTFTAFSLDHESIREDLGINEPPNPTSFNYVCHQSKLVDFLIPMFRIDKSSELGKKLLKSMDFLHITSSFKEEWRENLFIGKIHLEDYDYLVYFRDTNHSEQISLN